MPRIIDFAPLTSPVTPTEVAAFKVEAKARPDFAGPSTAMMVFVLVIVMFVLGSIAIGIVGAIGAVISTVTDSPIAATVVSLALIALLVFGTIVLVRASSRKRWESWYRLDRFASRNGMRFSPSDANPQYPGAIFSNGHSRQSLNHFRSNSSRFLDYGNYRYTTGSGKNRSTHNWGFLALALDRSLPHMVLDSRANNGLFGASNLPAAFQKDQILSLEGDFDNYFTLYCPRQYERDALYVFTPDLMALLIDHAAPFDVEVVDQWMFIYSAAPFDVLQSAVHHRLLSIVDTVGAKTLTQTDRYSDERVQDFAANVVAPQGLRLKRRFPLVAVIIVGAVLLWFFVVPFFTAIFAAFA
ncbi:MAG: hypothetical protein H7226_10705 [Salinibacterium sp.]|nr:hypothetical protein [Salinibacterium sp.]